MAFEGHNLDDIYDDYYSSGCETCPECGASGKLRGVGTRYHSVFVDRDVRCLECGSKFTEVYELSGVYPK